MEKKQSRPTTYPIALPSGDRPDPQQPGKVDTVGALAHLPELLLSESATPAARQWVWDRLVDNELSPAARQQVLASCQATPQLWRECALAFLEAQCWRDALQSSVADQPACTPLAPRKQAKSPARPSWSHGLTMAAGLLIAFGLGGFAQNFRADRAFASAQTSAPTGQPHSPSDTPDVKLVSSATDARLPDQVTLWVRDQNGVKPITIPVQPAATTSAPLPSTTWSPPMLELAEKFAAAGCTVAQRQRTLPARLRDGQLLLIPMHELEISSPKLAEPVWQ